MRNLKHLCTLAVAESFGVNALLTIKSEMMIDLQFPISKPDTDFTFGIEKYKLIIFNKLPYKLKPSLDVPQYPDVMFLNNITREQAIALHRGNIDLFRSSDKSKLFIEELSIAASVNGICSGIIVKNHSHHINITNAVQLYILACGLRSKCMKFIGDCILERSELFSGSPGGGYLVALFDNKIIDCDAQVVNLFRGRKYLW